MNLGFGFGEVLLIAMMVLIVFGPRRLPEVTRTIGKGIREFRKGMNEIQRELEAAGRETEWRSPPAPPKPKAAGETIAGTVAAAGATAAEGSAATTEEEKTEGAGADDAATDDAATDDEEQGAAPVLEEQAPPVPRDVEDPAAEFIDPWSTDSSRPNFGQPRPEPVIAPPTPAATAPAAASAEVPSETPAEAATEPPAEAPAGEPQEEAPAD